MEGIQPIRLLLILATDDRDQVTNSKLTLGDLASVYYLFKDLGDDIVLATLRGEYPDLPDIKDKSSQHQIVHRFMDDRAARDELADTLSLAQIDPEDFDAIFCLGISRDLWNFESHQPQLLLASFLKAGKPVAIFPARINIFLQGDNSQNGLIIDDNSGSALASGLALRKAVSKRRFGISSNKTTR